MSRAEKMYGKGAKIQPEEAEADKAAKATAGSPHKDVPSPPEKQHQPDASGMIALDDVHLRELKDMHSRHERERRDLHGRHELEHSQMQKRHEKDGASGDKKAPKDIGKSGTEP